MSPRQLLVATAVATAVVVASFVLVGPPAQAAAVTPLPVGTDVDYQLGGAVAPAANVGIVVRDRTEPPAAGAYEDRKSVV